MNVIIETDLGRDPDDFFAICYLAAAGVNIKAITVSPGDKDQIAVAKFLCKELGLDIPVGAGDVNRQKSSATGVHTAILKRYGAPLRVEPDGRGEDVIRGAAWASPGTTVFAIGPLSSLGKFLAWPSNTVRKVVMQGGFVGYDTHVLPVKVRLPKFEGKTTVGTFNMNGDIQGTLNLIGRENLERWFIGKNVCHTIDYDRERHAQVCAVPARNRAMELFREGMTMYLANHDKKLFHDPAAAVCMLHPEIGEWIHGKVVRDKNGWGTRPGEQFPDRMLVNIDYDKLWEHIARCD